MHIRDGFLDAKTCVLAAALAAGGLGYALHHARKTLPARKVPLLGLSAAFVFAAQMVKFPVAVGTSGHLLGGVLTAALLGPSAAVIVLAAVLIVQCLAFADGGITVLGANVFNMGIVGGAVAGMLYLLLARLAKGLHGQLVAAMVAAWAGVMLSALACVGELASSGTVTWKLAFPAMMGVHALIGIGEGVITALVLSAIASVRPELVLQGAGAWTERNPEATRQHSSLAPVLVFGMLAAVGSALFLSPFASQLPDGLEYVTGKLGFGGREKAHASLFADYTPLAAAIAAVALFALAWLAARALTPKTKGAGRSEAPMR
jgi:cobalt/nickel transport system permease protein